MLRELSEPEGAHRENLAGSSANYTADGDAAVLRLNGIFPFELLRHTDFSGVRRVAIEVFDGTVFVPYAEVEHDGSEIFEYRFPEVIDYSYQIRLRLLEGEGAPLLARKRPELY